MAEDDRKLYVGGLPFKLTKEHLFDMFEKYGKVEDAFIIKDRESGRSRGFGFVIFENEECMEEAIDGLHDTDMDGRKLVVQKAGKRRGGGGGGGGYRRGGGGGGGGYRGGGGGGYRGNRDYGGRSGGGGGAYGGGGGGGRYGSRDNGY